MNYFKKLVLGTILTFSLGAFALNAYVSLDGAPTQLVDTSGQSDEFDVG